MATITLNVPDGALPRVRDAYCAEYGYQPTLDDGSANPETKAAFTKRMIIEHVKQVARNYEGNLAAANARKASDDTISAIPIT